MAMFRISDNQLGQFQGEIAKRDAQIKRLRESTRVKKATSQLKTVGEIVGTGLAMGALRGKFADPSTGAFNVPGVEFDAELALGIAITGLGLLGAQTKGELAKWCDDILVVGSTILAGYGRAVTKNWIVSGELKLTGVSGEQISGFVGGYGLPAPARYQAPNVLDALAASAL